MSYIAVGLKVIEGLSQSVARSTEVSEDRILAGLVRLWHRVWSSKSEVLTMSQLAGVFGAEKINVIAEALCADFLEPVEGGFRVRGASRYLRVRAGLSKGGKAASGNLKRGSKLPGSEPGPQPEPAGTTAGKSPGFAPALTPSTEHRAPKKSIAGAVAPPVRESDVLCADFEATTGTAYLWQGAKDGVALARLLKVATLDEVRARWRKGLEAPPDAWISCRTVAQLHTKWNDLAANKTTTPPQALRHL